MTADLADDRVMCVSCAHLVAATRCINWQAARLVGPEVGAIRQLPQRCPGYAQSAGQALTEPTTENLTETLTEPVHPVINRIQGTRHDRF